MRRTKMLIQNHSNIAQDKDDDHNHHDLQITISYFFKTLKLLIMIFNCTFFLSMFWFTFCNFKEEWIPHDHDDNENFLSANDLVTDINHELSYSEKNGMVITIMYYSFTTLTTIGFGDITPVSDSERFIAAFIMLFGVAIFSLIMSEFLSILTKYNMLHQEVGTMRSAVLPQFFSTLEKNFNKGHLMKPELRDKIEKFFLYNFESDQNFSLKEQKDKDLYDQLPSNVQENLSSHFLF